MTMNRLETLKSAIEEIPSGSKYAGHLDVEIEKLRNLAKSLVQLTDTGAMVEGVQEGKSIQDAIHSAYCNPDPNKVKLIGDSLVEAFLDGCQLGVKVVHGIHQDVYNKDAEGSR
jgi:hypothetical protein